MKNKFLAPLASFLIIFIFGTTLVLANQHGNPPTQGGVPPVQGGVPPTQGGVPPPTTIKIDNPFRVGDTLFALLTTVVNNIILPIGGVLAVLAFIYSGFLYVTAQGNEKKITDANRALLYTAIGTALLLGAWTFANVIGNTIDKLKT